MVSRRFYVALATVFLIFMVIGIYAAPLITRAAPPIETPTPPAQQPQTVLPGAQPTPPPGADQAIQDAFEQAVQQGQGVAPAFLVYDVVIDNIQYSQDGTTALLWLALFDPQTGQVVESEPGLSIASNPTQGPAASAASWTITLPAEPTLLDQLETLPADLLTPEITSRFLQEKALLEVTSATVFSGYKLPWTAGLGKRITNSIGHVVSVSGGLTSCPSSCAYSFDFADGTMYPLLASKGGTIKAYRTSCANGDSNCTNYLVLEDKSTVPTTYQLYYHMAQNSIPSNLRVIGTPVRQGQYIGNADDTGFSTGHHLHLHVYLTPTGTNWSWGTSVDFTFDDVTTNDGRPRTCAEAREHPDRGSECMPNNTYFSGNTPANPPSGTLDLPIDREVITDRNLYVQGLANDDIEIVRIEVVGNYDGTWKTIGDIPPVTNTAYAGDVDLCEAGVPDGPFAMTVRIFDREGSQATGLPVRQIIKSFACGSLPEPPVTMACSPTANEVALYSQTDYRGDCRKFTAGSMVTQDQLGAVGSDRTASVQVGSNVRAVLYDRNSDVNAARPQGRIETLESSDASLSDNIIGINTVSGLWVVTRSTGPDEAFFNSPVGNQASGSASPTSVDSLVLSWEGGAGATSYDVSLSGGSTNITRSGTNLNTLSVGSLPAGTYRLSVTARNSAQTNQSELNFTVAPGSLPSAAARGVPYQDNMESGSAGWTATGLWRLGSIDGGGQAWGFNSAADSDYNDTAWKAGDLTSPPITLPASGTQYLRFDYFMDTESGSPYWDQRLVQISTNGQTFTNIFQLSEDKQEGQIWLKSGPISLAPYAGKTIWLRFHFDAIDEDYNSGRGWLVDNVAVSSTAPDTTCTDNSASPGTAPSLAVGASVTGVICPERDVDYYKVTATAGQPLVVDVDAKTLSTPSELDSYVFLLDSDGRSVIASNDDEQPGVLQDSWLPYIIGRSGTYYIKIRPWDYPGSGSQRHNYRITLRQDAPIMPQDVQITYPTAPNLVPPNTFDIRASATDFDGGPVAAVEFYWHGPDWNQSWVKLGTDSDSSNGWSFPVTPSQYGGVQGSALVVMARSRSGGVRSAAMWDLEPDNSLPVSQLGSLPATTNSNLVLLNWTASDPQNDIASFEVQYQVNNSNVWQAWQTTLPGSIRSAWFSGTPGSSYRFRIRGLDQVGNVEPFPNAAEANTALSGSCTPDANEAQGQTSAAPLALTRGRLSSSMNLCRSTQPGTGDVDWLSISAQQGEDLLLQILSRSGGAAFSVNIYRDPNTKLTQVPFQSQGYGMGVSIRWKAPETRTYLLELRPLRAEMVGTDMRYQVWYGPGNWIYLPEINR